MNTINIVKKPLPERHKTITSNSMVYEEIVSRCQQEPDEWFQVLNGADERTTNRVRSALTNRNCSTSRPSRKTSSGKIVWDLYVLWPSDGIRVRQWRSSAKAKEHSKW